LHSASARNAYYGGMYVVEFGRVKPSSATSLWRHQPPHNLNGGNGLQNMHCRRPRAWPGHPSVATRMTVHDLLSSLSNPELDASVRQCEKRTRQAGRTTCLAFAFSYAPWQSGRFMAECR
jgi:hypothetical protein